MSMRTRAMWMRMPLSFIPRGDENFMPFPGYGEKYRDYPDNFGHDSDTDAPWDAYTKAADTLQVVKSDNGIFTLSRNRSKSKSDLNHVARRARKELLRPALRKYYTDITQEDIENFDLMLDSAEKDFQVFDNYLSVTSGVIRHDSSVDDVIKQIPKSLITITGEPIFPEIVKNIIKKVKDWHEKELFYKYALFLPTSELVKSATSPDDCLEKLKDDPGFVAAFGGKYSYKLPAQLEYYLSYRIEREDYGEPDSEYKTLVEKCRQWELDEHLEVLSFSWHSLLCRLVFKTCFSLYFSFVCFVVGGGGGEARNTFPCEFMNPIHFLAHQKRAKGYTIQSQVVEIMKIRSCFGVFIRGVTLPGVSPIPMEPSSSSSSPSPPPRRSRKRVWDY